MKKSFGFKLLYVLAAITVLFNTFFSVKNNLFANIDELPEGKLKYSTTSPSGDRSFNVYLVKNVLGCALRGEIEFKDGRKKNIFWQTGMESLESVWRGDSTLLVNNVPISASGNTVYDCRKGTSLFSDGAVMEDILKKDDFN